MKEAAKLFCGRSYEKVISVGAPSLARAIGNQKAELAYLVGASMVRSGSYDRGKGLLLGVLDEHCAATTRLFGDVEKLRALAAAELACGAAEAGIPEDVAIAAKKCSPSLRTDVVVAHGVDGKADGRTSMRNLLSFFEAAALAENGRIDDAASRLDLLAGASGRLFWRGGVLDLQEAAMRLREEIGHPTK